MLRNMALGSAFTNKICILENMQTYIVHIVHHFPKMGSRNSTEMKNAIITNGVWNSKH